MIPVLFDKTATSYDSLGIGTLSDTVECAVAEERNGAFGLAAKIPVDGEIADSINVGNLIIADASPQQKRQAFEIYDVKKSIDGLLNVKANHISYRLCFSIIRPFSATGISAVMTQINTKSNENYIEGNPFTFDTDLTDTSTAFTLSEFRSVKNLLGGMDGSIVQTFGGCYKWDNWTVSLLGSRGADNGVRIVYGKNLTGLTAEYDLGDRPTAVFPIWTSDTQTVTGNIQLSQYVSLYPHHRTVIHDFADQFENAPTTAQLNAAGAAWINGKGLPSVNLKTSFIPLYQTVEYKDLANVESVEIDDTVHVYVPTLDVDVKAKVIKTKYNVLADRYDSVEVGNFRTSITDAIRSVRG